MTGQIAATSIRGSEERAHRQIDYAANAIGCEYNRNVSVAPNVRCNVVGTLWDNGVHYHFIVDVVPHESECQVTLSSLPENSYIKRATLRRKEIDQFLDAIRK